MKMNENIHFSFCRFSSNGSATGSAFYNKFIVLHYTVLHLYYYSFIIITKNLQHQLYKLLEKYTSL